MGAITEAYLLARGYVGGAPDGYICVKEAVGRFKISDSAVYRLISTHAVRVYYIGRTPLVHIDDIEAEAMRYRQRVAKRQQDSNEPALPLDALERAYPRGMTHDDAVAAYYREKTARVLRDARAVRELPDGRIAIDIGLLFG